MDDRKAAEIMNELYSVGKDTTVSVLTTSRPNVVILIMESWSADLIKELGGEAGITPQFSKLIKDGLFFNEIYASGPGRNRGWPVFSGIPRSSDFIDYRSAG